MHMSSKRREFIKKTAAAGIAMAWGLPVVYSRNIEDPSLLSDLMQDPSIPAGKHPDLTLLNDRPWNIETPPHLLDDQVTPKDKIFVRNNGIPPEEIDVDSWTLTIEGESSSQTKTYTLEELKSKFDQYTYQLTLECGGNGRSEFNPPAKGNQWTTGAVYSSEWTGIRLRDVLNDVGINADAVYIGYYGKDTHLSGDVSKTVISRGMPMSKAMEDETIIAFQLNGEDIPLMHGYPLRLIAGGWPASVSGKWLHKIVVRNQVHDGPKMTGDAYRVPCETVPPGTKVADEDMCIIESMPVKSLITYPKTGAMVKSGQTFEVRGHAWAGDLAVKGMEVSIDFGASWQECSLQRPINRLAWQHWKANISLKDSGYYEIWARAMDQTGKMQPMVVPGWNPKGYLNNACHRIAVKVS
jgi:sulfite oxidase